VNSALVFALLIFAGIAIAIVLPVLFRLYRSSRIEEITPEWLENFSASSYEPMEHLLGDEDFNFLKRQPGYDLAVLKRFRRERLRIFRQYLNRIIVDFNRLQLAARILVAHSADDRSMVLKHLVSLRLRFGIAVLQAEFSYALCFIGCNTVAAHGLIARLEEMSAQLNALTAANAFSAS
jgi:hypothetical protein